MSEKPTHEQMVELLHGRRNWGRWGEDDELGALNLIDDSKRLAAASLVRSGKAISLSQPLDAEGSPHNPRPVQHLLGARPFRSEGAGYAHDYLGLDCHNFKVTHIDALCHIWDEDGMWGGRRPEDVLTSKGSSWAGIDEWRDGVVTRGVLLDVPGLRGKAFVDVDEPIQGWELEKAADAAGVTVEAGDAICVFGGRAAWEDATRDQWSEFPPHPRPGLHGSCLEFIRDHDVAVLVWDMIDAIPSGYDLPWPVHGALISYGVALVDHARLEPLVAGCREAGRSQFMLVVAPLRIPGGTGSPVNPIAVL